MNLEKYTFPTQNGKLLSTEPFPNGNMLRSTAELLLLKTDLSEDESSSYYEGILDCAVRSGLFGRYPGSFENTSVDDYLVLGSDRILAFSILRYTRTHFGFADTKSKLDFKQFLPRFQGMWQHLRISAGENVGILGQLIWAISLVMAAKQSITNQDNWLLSHIMVITYERSKLKSWICDLAVKYWKSKKTLPSWQIMSYYLGPQCADHPLIEAWRPYN